MDNKESDSMELVNELNPDVYWHNQQQQIQNQQQHSHYPQQPYRSVNIWLQNIENTS